MARRRRRKKRKGFLPFRLVAGTAKLPVRLVAGTAKLPFRLFRSPSKRKKRKKTLKWQRTRRVVLKRDRHKCRRCGKRFRLQVHHKRPRSRGGKDRKRNLVTLCAKCHAKKHPKQKQFILSASEPRKRKRRFIFF